MCQNSRRKITALGMPLLFLTGVAFGSTPRAAPQEGVQETTTGTTSARMAILLEEIQRETVALSQHAATLESRARSSDTSWQTQAYYLDKIKRHINAVGEQTVELQAIREDVLPRQKQAIDEVTFYALEVASSTEAAIIYLRENRIGCLFRSTENVSP